MKRNVFILIFFFSFLGVVLAQEKRITIKVIIDDEQEEHLGSVYITNSRNNSTQIALPQEAIQISVQIDDVLYFSSSFYEYRSFYITPKIFDAGKANVHLNIQTVVLDEAKLSNFQLTGDLAKDAENARFDDKVKTIYKNLGIQEIDVPPPNPAGAKVDKFKVTDIVLLKIPKIIGEINGFNERQRKTHKFEKHQSNQEFIRSQWEDSYFIDELKIPSHKIQEFIYFVYETTDIYEKVKNNNILEAEIIFVTQSRNYLERLNSPNTLHEK